MKLAFSTWMARWTKTVWTICGSTPSTPSWGDSPSAVTPMLPSSRPSVQYLILNHWPSTRITQVTFHNLELNPILFYLFLFTGKGNLGDRKVMPICLPPRMGYRDGENAKGINEGFEDLNCQLVNRKYPKYNSNISLKSSIIC